jgi:hypothetical protein
VLFFNALDPKALLLAPVVFAFNAVFPTTVLLATLPVPLPTITLLIDKL